MSNMSFSDGSPRAVRDRMDFSRRIPELDGLRGVAIALVLGYHLAAAAVDNGAPLGARILLSPLSIGWCGVDLFFVLSGFLIGGILIDARGSANYFRAFYTRRICRIFPLYFVFMPIAAVLVYFSGSFVVGPWKLAPVFAQNFWMAAHDSFGTYAVSWTWSLAVEEQFYILLPALIWLVAPRQLPKFLCAGILAAPVLRTALFLFVKGSDVATYVLLPCRMDALLIGVALAWALRQPGGAEFLRVHRRQLWTAIEILTAVSAVYFFDPHETGLLADAVLYDSLALLFASLIAASLIDAQLSRALRCRWLMGLGSIAYGAYLIHPFVLGYAEMLYRGPARIAVSSAIGIFATIAIAKISWEWFEKPIVRLGHRVSYTAAPPKVKANLAPAEAR